jgi:hypothetical protein
MEVGKRIITSSAPKNGQMLQENDTLKNVKIILTKIPVRAGPSQVRFLKIGVLLV